MNDVTDHDLEAQLRAWADDLADQVTPYASDVTTSPCRNGGSPRRRLLPAAAAFAVVAAGVVAFVVIRDRGDEVMPVPRTKVVTPTAIMPTATTAVSAAPPPASREWRASDLPIGSAELGTDGRTLTVSFTAGAPYNPRNPCSEDYRVVADELPDEVRLRLELRRPPSFRPGVACILLGYGRSASVELHSELGERHLRDAGSGDRIEVDDERLTASVGRLPDGWKQARHEPTFWSPSSGRACTAFQVRLIQGAPAMLDEIEPEGRRVAVTSVRGNRAEHWRWDRFPRSELRWTENGQGLLLSSRRRCDDEGPATLAQLLAIARALDVPPA